MQKRRTARSLCKWMTDMKIQTPDCWADLLWNHYWPQIETGTPFYLAVDSTLIHALSLREKPGLSSTDALLCFNQACQRLVHKKLTRASLRDNSLKQLSSKPYSSAICLAAQQVLVVEQMLDRDEYSSRSYFPWYRQTLEILSGHRHENPLGGCDFQRIWSTLRSEIQNVPGSSSVSITFKAGKGVDLNRNLPFSQALLTSQDLSFVHKHNNESTLKQSTDEMIIKLLHLLRSSLNKRAKELISKASSDDRLRLRLCEQIRSFDAVSQLSVEITSLKKESASQEWLVAYRDIDNWLDQIYCVFLRAEEKHFDEIPSPDSISNALSENGIVALVRRDDHYKQISQSDPFVPHDFAMLIIRKEQYESILKRFSQAYQDAPITYIGTNLPEQFLLLDCGSLPHSLLFDPLGRKSTNEKFEAISFIGGLLVDTRSNTFLTGYAPTGISHDGERVPNHLKLKINGSETTVDAFLRKLALTRTLSSFIVEIGDDTSELTVSSTLLKPKSQVLLGFSLDSGQLEPSASPLNESQPSLRGTVLVEEPLVKETESDCLTATDLLLLTRRGRRLKLSEQSLNAVVESIKQSSHSPHLLEIILREVSRTKSIPIDATQASTIQAILRNSCQRQFR